MKTKTTKTKRKKYQVAVCVSGYVKGTVYAANRYWAERKAMSEVYYNADLGDMNVTDVFVNDVDEIEEDE